MKNFKELLLLPLVFLGIWLGIKWYKMPIMGQGVEAPDFTGYMADGDSLRLSDYKGQIVLLHFWGSWCGPCRQHNQHLVQLYKTYRGKSFEQETAFKILSVGIETNKQQWLRAIEKDGLEWTEHVSDIQRLSDHVALLYGIKEIPSSYLIDGKGRIIGVNPSIDELDEILTKRSQN